MQIAQLVLSHVCWFFVFHRFGYLNWDPNTVLIAVSVESCLRIRLQKVIMERTHFEVNILKAWKWFIVTLTIKQGRQVEEESWLGLICLIILSTIKFVGDNTLSTLLSLNPTSNPHSKLITFNFFYLALQLVHSSIIHAFPRIPLILYSFLQMLTVLKEY